MSATRFTENDVWLGKEITKLARRYFYVRTKLGSDLSSNRKAHPRTHDEAKVIDELRTNLVSHLKKSGCERTPVFLVDSYKPQKYDFEQLEQNLNRDFPEMKRSAMILSMSAYSRQMVRMKVKTEYINFFQLHWEVPGFKRGPGRDGVLGDWPRPRGHLKDKSLWPWPWPWP